MTTQVLICDDSQMARKQVARSLPDDWDVEISYASNGMEALAAIRAGNAEIVFLDLTMPELDGYGVLQAVRDESLKSMFIVISGDIQPEAVNRVKALGAIDFIRKPVSAYKLRETLAAYGLL